MNQTAKWHGWLMGSQVKEPVMRDKKWIRIKVSLRTFFHTRTYLGSTIKLIYMACLRCPVPTPRSQCIQRISFVNALFTMQITWSEYAGSSGGHTGLNQLRLASSASPLRLASQKKLYRVLTPLEYTRLKAVTDKHILPHFLSSQFRTVIRMPRYDKMVAILQAIFPNTFFFIILINRCPRVWIIGCNDAIVYWRIHVLLDRVELKSSATTHICHDELKSSATTVMTQVNT